MRHDVCPTAALSRVLKTLVESNLDVFNFTDDWVRASIQAAVSESEPLGRFAALILRRLFAADESGYVLLRLDDFQDEETDVQMVATLICHLAGEPFRIYGKEPFWSPLDVRLEAAPNRTYGTGYNPYHIDLLKKTRPPEVIAFLCQRPDPLGGGYTELGLIGEAIRRLSEEDYRLLSQPVFKYWSDTAVYNVGGDLEYFSVIPQDPATDFIRFNAKIIPHLDGSDTVVRQEATALTHALKRAYENLENELKSLTLRTRLVTHEMLLFSQKRYVHARSPLGSNQEAVPAEERRVILQGYVHRVTAGLA